MFQLNTPERPRIFFPLFGANFDAIGGDLLTLLMKNRNDVGGGAASKPAMNRSNGPGAVLRSSVEVDGQRVAAGSSSDKKSSPAY